TQFCPTLPSTFSTPFFSQHPDAAPLSAPIQNVVNQRIYPRFDHIRITLPISSGAEDWARIPPLTCTMLKIVQDRIHSRRFYVGVPPEVPALIEKSRLPNPLLVRHIRHVRTNTA